ncbi:pirin family protein [Variovorax sp. VNK109]|uniref:pirin family protein n=1 Tax=Variovorax sp. VNK109 TaxID=3400919 RepID=UPI003BFB6061
MSNSSNPTTSPILAVVPLGFPWQTVDPFLFCAYHDDAYPTANADMGPATSLAGRDIGQDFSRKDGWSMYHGDTVPGFPAHPHRGFETVTIVRKGLIDHSDSLGAKARFGGGDVQWVTAGKGIVHSEMFPLLDTAGPNPVELFQIWLNLPAARKMAEPHFTMLWADEIPHRVETDASGRKATIAVVAGKLADTDAPPSPPPDSWAAQADADVSIWTLRLDAGASWTLPAAAGADTQRVLYFFKGTKATIAGQAIDGPKAIQLRGDAQVQITGGDTKTEFLLLQGRPIGEPVAQYGPFVMNTQAEIQQAMQDYRRTEFGGWPWPAQDPSHGRDPARFAVHPGGREERPAGDNAGSEDREESTA